MADISKLPKEVSVSTAVDLYNMGFVVIPIKLIKEGDKWRKVPLIKGWDQYGTKDQSITEVMQFNWDLADGMAILTGIKLRGKEYYIGALDFDEGKAYEKVKHLIPETYVERTPRGGYHLLFLCEEPPKLISFRREGQRGEVFAVLGLSPNGKPKLCTIYPSKHYEVVVPKPLAVVKNLNAIASRVAHELGLLEVEKKEEFPRRLLELWFEKIKPHLKIAKETDKYYLIHCPFHPPDEHPSFIIYKDSFLAVDLHPNDKGLWTVYTLKELAKALGIDLLDGTHLGRAEVEGKTINFVRIEDNYDAIVSEIAETSDIRQLIAILEDTEARMKTNVSEKAYLLASAISAVITFVRVIYGEDAKLWYFDGYTLCPRSEELINIIVRRLLLPYRAVTVNVVNETIRNVMAFAPIEVPRGQLDPVRYLPLKNTALDLETLEPVSYEELAKRKAFFTSQLRYDLDLDIINKIKEGNITPEEIAPEFHRFLTRFYEGEDLEKIQLALGYILSPYQGKKPIVLVIGPPDTGKSTLKEILQYVLSPFISSLSLDDMVKEFGLAPLVGKRANISSEKPTLTINTEKIKRITGGEVLMVNEKYRPQYPAVINPVLIHLMNDPPKFSQLDDALVDRVIIVRTSNPLMKEEKDPMFLERMKKEGGKILHYIIWCYKKLRDTGFIIPQDRDEVYDTLLSGRSNVKKFLEAAVEFDASAEIKGTELYDAYLKWCGENGESALGMRAFYEDVIYYGMGKIVKKQKQRALYFVGIRLKEEFVQEEPQTPEEAIIRIIKRLDNGEGADIVEVYREFKVWADEHGISDEVFDKVKNMLEDRGEIVCVDGKSRYKVVV